MNSTNNICYRIAATQISSGLHDNIKENEHLDDAESNISINESNKTV
jgi:hypothetical protein